MRKSEKTKYAREVMEANPSVTAHRTLAKLIYAKYPLIFKDIETARSHVRAVMGKSGKRKQHEVFTSAPNISFLERLTKLRAQLEIEPETKADTTPYNVHKSIKKALVINDTHIPYQDMQALDIALEYAYKADVDAVIFNGDLQDFNTISRFLSRPDEMRMIDTIAEGKKLLKYIHESLGCKVIFHEGNHDIRCEAYLIQKAPEFWGLPSVELKNLLGCDELGIDYVANIRTMRFGKLNIAHGNHIVKGIFSPVNPARGAFVKANASLMIGHCHRSSEHIETDIRGKVTGCWSVGCLTTVNPVYNPQVSKHNQGFAIIEMESDKGDFTVDNKKIIGYKVR